MPKDTHSVPEGKPVDLDADLSVDYYHAPSERFLVLNEGGRWIPHSTTSYKRILVNRGLQSKAANGQSLSEVDQEIIEVQNHRDVTQYGPLCGRDAGFIEENGTRYLVTEDMNLIEPMEGFCPNIHAILHGMFVKSESPEIGETQLHTACGFLKSSIEAFRAGRPQQQQALAICGPKDCGKSLFQHLIVTPCLAGRSADGERYFIHGNDFNAELFKAEHLFLDDAHSSTSTRDRVAFGAKIKAHTVGAAVKSLHAKGKDAVNVAPWWRLTITLNDTPEDLMVLPPLTDGVEDKLILLRASRFDFPEPIAAPEDKVRFAQKIRAEIPAFLFWLLYKHTIPEKYADRRYNVATYHHPDLKKELSELSPQSELLELIDLAYGETFKLEGKIRRTAAKIEEKLHEIAPHRARRIFRFANSCGSYLGRLAAWPRATQSACRKQTQLPNGVGCYCLRVTSLTMISDNSGWTI